MSEQTQDPQAPEDAPQQDEPERQDAPDEDAGPSVEPAEGDQGEYVEQSPASANAGDAGFDPDRPVRTSAPTAEQQSGVPQPTDGSNEGVEGNPDYRGPVEPSRPETGQAPGEVAEDKGTQGEPHGDDTGAEPTPASAEQG